MKARRQSAVLDAIRRQPVRSQEQLRRTLRGLGFDVTQATLSRDIRELGLVKGGPDGAYQDQTAARGNGHQAAALLHRSLVDYVVRVDRVQQMVLLRTGPGQAQMVGVALDGAALPGVVGTVAGDDTLLVIARDVARAKALVKRLDGLAGA